MNCPFWDVLLRGNSGHRDIKVMRTLTRLKHYKVCPLYRSERYCDYVLRGYRDPQYVDVPTETDKATLVEIEELKIKLKSLKTQLNALKAAQHRRQRQKTKIDDLSRSIVSRHAKQQYRLVPGNNVYFSDHSGKISISFSDLLTVVESLATHSQEPML